MTHVIFKFLNKAQISDLINKFTLINLQDKNSFNCVAMSSVQLSHKNVASLSVDELISLCISTEKKLGGITLLSQKLKIHTDEKLLAFGDSYLGCVLSVPKKNELLDRLNVLRKIEHNNDLPSKFFTPRGSVFNDYLSKSGLNKNEIEELDEIVNNLKEPLEKWASKREKILINDLVKFPKLISKNF